MLAIPNYARMNRVDHDHSAVAGDSSVNYAPGATGGSNNNAAAAGTFQGSNTPANSSLRRIRGPRKVDSKVWMQSAT
jgi:hypothetical protein